jgi:hypothetical protein
MAHQLVKCVIILVPNAQDPWSLNVQDVKIIIILASILVIFVMFLVMVVLELEMDYVKLVVLQDKFSINYMFQLENVWK